MNAKRATNGSSVLKQTDPSYERYPAMNPPEPISPVIVEPKGPLEVLSRQEIQRFHTTAKGNLHDLLRICSLAVLACGTSADDARALFQRHENFDIQVLNGEGGLQLQLHNPPPEAFVDGCLMRGIREHLFALVRDLIFTQTEVLENPTFDLASGAGITNAVFHILRNARVLVPEETTPLAVCWGGHAISREEYEYSKKVGYELGLRGMHIGTGCGPGAMKGPMKGATIGHAKQRLNQGRYVGITEPGIIAAEPPNPIVNELVVLPDMEKRLEAFVRLAHGIIIFPGGPGTTEELLYLLGILMHPDNSDLPYPVILTGPDDSRAYLEELLEFLRQTLGEAAIQRLTIAYGHPSQAARAMAAAMALYREYRRHHGDPAYFNWALTIDPLFQQPFLSTHEAMATLNLERQQSPDQLAAQLRRAFSGIVTGNVKEWGIRQVAEFGPYELHGDPHLLHAMDRLLSHLIREQRMRLYSECYHPCYRLVA